MAAFYVWAQKKVYALPNCMKNIPGWIKNSGYLKRGIEK